MERGLVDGVRQRLDAADLDEQTAQLVIAACADVPLDAAATAEWPEPAGAATPIEGADGVFLDGITVQGFRGIGPARRLDLTPGPGLTVVCGRNGSGKSSFAEGLEMALTGTSHRWEGKLKVWQEAWRNLHHRTDAQIALDLTMPPDGAETLTHSWADDADLSDGTTERGDGRRPDTLGWTSVLEQYRPILSFNELGGMFDGKQSDLYDAMALILGVDPVRDAVERLRQARLADEKPIKESKKALPSLIATLRESTDERAEEVLAALDGRTWDLGAAMRAVEDDDSALPSSDLNRLRGLAALQAPSPIEAEEVATALREAVRARDAAAATDAGRADRLAALLDAAVTHVHDDGTTACPLCGSGTLLDDGWAKTAQHEITALREQADAVRQADTRLAGAMSSARGLMRPVPDVLEAASFVGLDAAPAIEAWKALVGDAPDDPAGLAEHLVPATQATETAIGELRSAASAELDRRQSDWRPVAHAVTTWVSNARTAQTAERRAKAAGVAEKWLAGVASELEAERFEPIRDAVQGYWSQLKLESNVDLKHLHLKRSGARRSLELDVAVDGSDASALGVMSQGELHALALAVFLPRATLEASPFKFLVLDDPVQAMDPSKVSGLATVLDQVAQTRQVVVFTHDTRLPDAVRDLQIDATIIEVSRGDESVVTLRESLSPVKRYLDDAFVIMKQETLGQRVQRQLIAQMGRAALEAAAVDAIRRQRLGRGDRHADIEAQIADAKGVHALMTLAIWGDPRRNGDLFPTLARWGGYVDAFKDCKEGAHRSDGRTIDPDAFLTEIRGLVGRLQRETAG